MLDVAGGAGTLSFELLNLHGVACTIVDPRPPCFRRARKVVTHIHAQQQRLLLETAPATDGSGGGRCGGDDSALVCALQMPSWLPVWFGPWLWRGPAAQISSGSDGVEFKQKRDAEAIALQIQLHTQQREQQQQVLHYTVHRHVTSFLSERVRVYAKHL